MRATRFTDSVTHHGEGPVWWATTGELRFVDMLHGAVVAFTPAGDTYRLPVGSPVAAVLRPRVGGGAIVARERDIALARADDLSDLAPCTPGASNVWRLDAAATAPDVVTPVVVIPTATVSLLDYRRVAGLTDRRPWVVLPEEAGHPDGLTVDAEGGVWVAPNGGAAVHRYDDAGRLSAVVEVGARKVTACAFGGQGLDTLFITTSREDLAPDEDPAAGSLYAVAPGVRGLPPLPFRG